MSIINNIKYNVQYIKTFENFTELNQERGPQISNTEPSFNYSEIQDILGNKYSITATTESLEDFNKKVIKDTNNTDSEFFIKTWLEHQRNTNRLTPPLSDSEELVKNSDFYKRGFKDSLKEEVSGMGAVVSPTVSSVPGQTVGGTGTTGSGDIGVGIGSGLRNNFIKRPTNSRRKSKAEAAIKAMTKSYQNQIPDKVSKQINNVMSFEEFTKANTNEARFSIPSINLIGEYFHGSVIIDNTLINRFTIGFSDYDCIWVSDNEKIAEEFSDNGLSDDIHVVYKTKLNIKKIADISYDLSQYLIDKYELDDFRDIINILKDKGFNGWKTIGSIGRLKYNDYAIFHSEDIKILSVKLLIDGNWSEYMSIEEGQNVINNLYENE